MRVTPFVGSSTVSSGDGGQVGSILGGAIDQDIFSRYLMCAGVKTALQLEGWTGAMTISSGSATTLSRTPAARDRGAELPSTCEKPSPIHLHDSAPQHLKDYLIVEPDLWLQAVGKRSSVKTALGFRAFTYLGR